MKIKINCLTGYNFQPGMEVLTDGKTIVLNKNEDLKVGKIDTIFLDGTMEVEIYDNQEEKFTVSEFKKYIESQDSLGDVMYFLTPEKIKEANLQTQEEEDD